MRIMLLEDNKRLNDTITKRLEVKGFHVSSFTDGIQAYEHIDEGYLCFVLDINVPSMNGIEILKKVREYHSYTPIIIISSSVELDIIKDSYRYGCNDYLKKPFFIDELEIKIEKLCHLDDDLIMISEDCQFSLKESVLIYNGKPQHLSKKERLLLNLLISKQGKVVSFDTIQEIVWEGNFVSIDSIRSLVRRIRKKIPYEWVDTVVDVGYLFKKSFDK